MNFIKGSLAGQEFTGGGLTIPVTRYDFSNGSRHEGPAIMGIRPEHVLTEDMLAGADMTHDIVADLVEPMGADTLVWSTLGGDPFRFRMDGQAHVKAGDTVTIGFNLSRISLFDPKTEDRL